MKNWKPCWCRLVAAILIIVLVWWWTPTWADWAITVLAAIIALISLSGKCCCAGKCSVSKDNNVNPAE